MLVGPNGQPLPPSEEEAKKHMERINAILRDMGEVYNKHQVTFNEGQEIIGNLTTQLLMQTGMGQGEAWAKFFVGKLVQLLQMTLPAKADLDAAKAGALRAVNEAKGQSLQ